MSQSETEAGAGAFAALTGKSNKANPSGEDNSAAKNLRLAMRLMAAARRDNPSERRFAGRYTLSLLVAAAVFGIVFLAVQILPASLDQLVKLTALTPDLVIIPVVFLILGWPLAYWPSRFAAYVAERAGQRYSLLIRVLFGALIGLLFVPLCAGIHFMIFHGSDNSSYLARCTLFSLPMVVSGATGGWTFWLCGRGRNGIDASIADEFS